MILPQLNFTYKAPFLVAECEPLVLWAGAAEKEFSVAITFPLYSKIFRCWWESIVTVIKLSSLYITWWWVGSHVPSLLIVSIGYFSNSENLYSIRYFILVIYTHIQELYWLLPLRNSPNISIYYMLKRVQWLIIYIYSPITNFKYSVKYLHEIFNILYLLVFYIYAC